MSVFVANSGWRTPLLAILVVGPLLGAALLVFTPCYMQNDDVVMAMIASGRGVALQPDAHLVYVNVVLGELLCRAYTWVPALPWYGLLLIAALAGAQVALVWKLLARSGQRRVGLLLYSAYFVAVANLFVVRLEFTAVAGLVAGSGIALWVAGLPTEAGGHGRRFWSGLVVPTLLLLLGGLLRFDALLLALVVAAPLCVDRLVRLGRSGARPLAGLLAVLLACVALHLWDRGFYDRDPGWREFRQLNAWRARIVDYGAGGDGPEGQALARGVGWSANDALMLRRWFYADRKVFPIDAMRILVGEAPVTRPDAAEVQDRLHDGFRYPSFLPILLVLPLLVACGGLGGRVRVLLLTFVPAVVVLAALSVYMRAPEHVGLPTLAFAPTALLVASGPRQRQRRGGGWWLSAALALAAVAIAARQCRQDTASAQQENAELRASLAMLPPQPQRLYVDWAGTFRYEAILPLEDTSYLSGLRLYSLGWPQRSPIADRMLQAFAIDDLFRSFYERPEVGVLMWAFWRDSLEAYAREHYGAAVHLSEVLRTPAFTVFRLERVGPASRPSSG